MIWNQYIAPWSPRMSHTLAVTPATFGPKPDLVIYSINTTNGQCTTVPGSFCWTQANVTNTPQAVWMTVTIKNIGTAPAVIPANMELSIMLLNNNAPTSNPGKYMLINSATTLAAGATYTFQTDSHFNYNPIAPGPYTLKASIDPSLLVQEVNDGNNMGGNIPITIQ